MEGEGSLAGLQVPEAGVPRIPQQLQGPAPGAAHPLERQGTGLQVTEAGVPPISLQVQGPAPGEAAHP